MDCSITITPIFAVEKHGTNYKYVKILIADYPNTIFVVRNFVESYNSTPTTSERAHTAAPPFQIKTASLGCDLIFLNLKFQILS